LKHISPWSMVEVYLLGLFIAYTRLTALAQVDLQAAVYSLVGLMLSMAAADCVMDDETIWGHLSAKGLRHRPAPEPDALAKAERLVGCHHCHAVNDAAEHDCGRCGTILHRRKPNSIRRCWALLLAAAMLYIPANGFAVMSTIKVGHELSHTILGGADELLEAGLWPLALLVFVASIMVPMLKFVSLGMMLITIHRGSAWRLRERTKLFRVIDFIGRWSMIDVFMISILVALVQFGQLAQVTSGSGAVAFASVVILTMLATEMFDPRLMWDASGDNR
jgi:paraquat-inducible protein A